LTSASLGASIQCWRLDRLVFTAPTSAVESAAMNELLWIAQVILAGVFLFTDSRKIFAYNHVVKVVEARSKDRPIGIRAPRLFS